MKNRRYIFLAALCAVFLGACSGPMDHSDKGIIRINLGDDSARGAVTAEQKAAMIYRITLHNGDETREETLQQGVAAANFEVAPGVWEIIIIAWLNEQDKQNDKVFGAGSGSVPVTAGQISQAKIIMKQTEEPIPPEPPVPLDPSDPPVPPVPVEPVDPEPSDPSDPSDPSVPPVDPEPSDPSDPSDPPDPPDVGESGECTIYFSFDDLPSGPQVSYISNVDSITISRSGSDDIPQLYEVKIADSGRFTNIAWEVPGDGVMDTRTGTGDAFMLDATKPYYNSIGDHVLFLKLEWNEIPYLFEISFEVKK